MTPFLTQVASHYISRQDLHSLCFVFPNRRAGRFFENAIKSQATGPVWLPKIVAMGEWVCQLTDSVPVGSLESIMLLFKAYRSVMGERAETFDRFIYWAQLILNDFDDADNALADIAQLYGNLRDLRHISTDYLEPELKKTLIATLNIQLPFSSGERFWNGNWHTDDNTDKANVKKAYFDLWDRLHDIYDEFHRLLDRQHLSTQGHIYRRAAAIADIAAEVRKRDQGVVFVGFETLTPAQLKIFKALRQASVAEFWWDNASPVFALSDGNPAAQAINVFAQTFPMPEPLAPLDGEKPKVNIFAVAAESGQARWAIKQVERLVGERLTDPGNAINTAIVLPDESLFVPLINNIGNTVGKVNITMGYPLKSSSIASLMRQVVKAHKQATVSADGYTFYREDVADILSHPLIKTCFPDEAIAMANQIAAGREWSIPHGRLAGLTFAALFRPVKNVADPECIIRFIDNLIQCCNTIDGIVRVVDADRINTDPEKPENIVLPLQSAFIIQYVEALHQLRAAFITHGVPATDDTIFYLIDRILQHYVIPFEGEPLEGLQIMGLLETRTLDFKNLIILSMNERVMPRRSGIHSFIPDEIRAAFMLPTAEHQETVAAYQFYRMIARARDISLIYCSNGDQKSAEPSRFIHQMLMLYKDRFNITEASVSAQVRLPDQISINVGKQNAPLHDYTGSDVENDENAPCLSASSIKEYLKCPMKFYFHHVEHLNDDNDKTDFMGAADIGNIIHNTLQEIYFPDINGKQRTQSFTITKDYLKSFLRDKLLNAVKRRINRDYLHQDDDSPVAGEALLLLEPLTHFTGHALRYDLQKMEEAGIDSFEVVECEVQHKVNICIDGLRFNFNYKPDRVDRFNGQLRIIDYKTGRDKTSFTDIEQLFAGAHKSPDAILQLLLYCNAWVQKNPDEPITPIILQLSEMDKTGIFLTGPRGAHPKQIVFNSNDELNAKFCERLAGVIRSLVDKDTPFGQANDTEICKYCHFVDFCRR